MSRQGSPDDSPQATSAPRPAATRRRANFRERLLDVSLALTSGVEAPTLMQLITQAAVDVVGGQCACIRTVGEDDGRLVALHIASEDGCCRAPEDLAVPLELAREAMAGNQVATGTSCVPGCASAAIGAAPMTVQGQPIGVLFVRARPGDALSAQQLSALRLLAAQAAIAVHHARLHEIASRRSEHMEVVANQALREEARARAVLEIAAAVTEKTDLPAILADVTRAACTEIGFERARVYLADHEHHTLEGRLEARAGEEPEPIEGEVVALRRDPGHPLAEAALGSAPYIIDIAREPTSQGLVRYERLYVPLVTQRMLVGLIVADNPTSGEPVSPQRTRLLHALAGLASVAIERSRVDKLRASLISAVSHELRAPLASIRAYNELVMGGDAGAVNEEQHMYLSRVERACKRLERVIEDVMNISKLRAGEVAISRSPTDLSNLIHAVMDTVSPRAREAGVTVEFEPPDGLPSIVTDPGRVEQVLTNLVDNAIKFNDRGGWVRVGIGRDDDEVTISVADNGPGIPASQHATIFEEFHHGTDERSRAKEGAGLGLAIARRVMDMLGGRLWLESEVGHGSTFHMAIPMETAADPAR